MKKILFDLSLLFVPAYEISVLPTWLVFMIVDFIICPLLNKSSLNYHGFLGNTYTEFRHSYILAII